MSDSKTTYSTTVSKVKQAAKSNSALSEKLKNGINRNAKYGSGGIVLT